jgi:hypothetical protein
MSDLINIKQMYVPYFVGCIGHRKGERNSLDMLQCMQGSSQGILACRAGTRVPPAGTHETNKKKKKILNSFFHVLCMYLSSKHAEMHSNTLLLPFY